MKILPKFRGYTIDCRLQQFRKIPYGVSMLEWEFIDFKSDKGDELIVAYLKTSAGKRALKDGSFYYDF